MENSTKQIGISKDKSDKKQIAELFKGVDEDVELNKDD